MMIRIGIIGYGNLGKGVELAILNNNDMELKAIFTRRDPDNIKTITNTNELLGYLDGVNGVKTGFTNGAGRCLVTSVTRNGFNIITVVLGADTKKTRTKDSINLIEYIYKNYEIVNLEELVNKEFEKWKKVNANRIIVNKGEKQSVKLGLGNFKYKLYPIKKEEIDNIRISINSLKYLEAPVEENTKIGKVTLQIGDSNVESIDIITKNIVNKKSARYYFIELIGNFKNVYMQLIA